MPPGRPTLISAPTGSGKTLAAFLICIDTLLRKAIDGSLPAATAVVYVSPLKALSNDVQKNLEAPLREIQQLALERGYLCPHIRTAVRTGDTLPAERRAMLKPAASHSRHHAGVALHPADRGKEPEQSLRGGDGDRGRDPRGRR